MSGAGLFVTIAVTWVAIGIGLAMVLGRRGHDPFSWFVMGTLLGPLAVVFAVDTARHAGEQDPEILATPVAGPATRTGSVDVLVGFDGSEESRAAIRSAVELFGERLGRLTLATVIPHDGGADLERSARAALRTEAQRYGWLGPGLELLRGAPARALGRAAVDHGYDLVVVGRTGTGRARLSGRTAADLPNMTTIPVLVAGPPTGTAGRSPDDDHR